MVRRTFRGDTLALPDIFDEVEEDLRAERARALGRRYWGAVVGAVVLTLIATGAYVFWQQRSTDAADAVASRFIANARQADRAAGNLASAKPDADTETAEQSLAEIGKQGPAGYSVLARLRLAALQWGTGQHGLAVATWQSVTDDAAAPALLRDVATLTSAQHQIDSADPGQLKQRLETLTGAGSRFAPMAEQMIALVDLRTGHAREAAGIMRRLASDASVPEGIRGMATDLLSTLPAELVAPPSAGSKPSAPVPAHG